MQALSAWLRERSTVPVVALAAAAFVLFAVLVLPAESARADRFSGGEGSPDLSLVYSSAGLYRMAEAYGEEGRREYVRARFTFDLVWPLVYGSSLVSVLGWLSPRAWPASRWGGYGNLVPLAGVVADYLENLSAAAVMARYPEPSAWAAVLAPAFTFIKWGLLGLSAALILVTVVAAGWVRLGQGRGNGG